MRPASASVLLATLLSTFACAGSAAAQTVQTRMPEESAPHEGTWLQWPHEHTYGLRYRNRIEGTWIEMTRALVTSEKVHVIAYDAAAQSRIQNQLTAAGVPLAKVDFRIGRTDDCWARDNGPVFVYGQSHQLQITDWGFNGWGLDAPHALDEKIPGGVARSLGLPRTRLNAIVLEGGAIEVDGRGVLMATRSSILEPKRNPGLTQAQLETALTEHPGATKFLWLDGKPGGHEDITDMHVDGFARFATADVLVTMRYADLRYWGLSHADVTTLYAATDLQNQPYRFVKLPLTQHDIVTTYGFDLGYKGSYVNFYTGNTVVLMPTYADPQDAVAQSLLQLIFPQRAVIGIDVRNLYRNGGMIHCVTQQQPIG